VWLDGRAIDSFTKPNFSSGRTSNFDHQILTSTKLLNQQRLSADGILIPHLRQALIVGGNFKTLSHLVIFFFISLLAKMTVLVVAGYFISKLITNTKASNESERISKNFKETLSKNAYQNLHSDIEVAHQIRGLKIHHQNHMTYQKPVFYFQMDSGTTKNQINTFLASLPEEFEVHVPALKTMGEDSNLLNLYFWKSENQFQLAIKKHTSLTLLETIEINSLTEKIFEQSAGFNFQNISVQRLGGA